MKATIRSRNSAYRFIDAACNTLGERFEKPHEISIEPVKSVRSLEQNAYLWGVCYKTILDHSLREQGWRAEDLHEYFLGEMYGWQSLAAFGRKRMRPVHRSSNLKKSEFSDFIAFVHQKAAEMGVFIPDPEET